MTRPKDSLYSDLNRHFGENNDIRIRAIDVESVYNAIETIMTTSPKERIFNPEFGSNIEQLLFEPIDDLTASRMLFELVVAIQRWDTRIIVDTGISTVVPDYDNNAYYVTIVFTIAGLESDSNTFERVISR